MERHTLEYEVLNDHNPDAESGGHWEIEVHASPEELQAFAETGYLEYEVLNDHNPVRNREGLFQGVREGLFQGVVLQKLRDALDRLEEREWEKRDNAMAGKRGWGFIPRHLMDKDEAFLGSP